MIYKGFYVDKNGNVLEYFDNTPKLTVEIPYGHKPTGENFIKIEEKKK